MSGEEAEISRIKIKFIIEGLGEAEGELVRFLAPRTVAAIAHYLIFLLNKRLRFPKADLVLPGVKGWDTLIPYSLAEVRSH